MMTKSVDVVNQTAAQAAEDVFESIHAVMHVFRAQQYRVLRDGPHGVTHMESKVLGFFARRRGATQSDLVAHSGRDKGQVARLIGGLRERGLLEARADEADRRNLRLHLTREGRAAHHTLQRQGRRLAAVGVNGLNAAERRELVALLNRVRVNLESAP
jgi:DNA-binding MarR family transcriptional regulator